MCFCCQGWLSGPAALQDKPEQDSASGLAVGRALWQPNCCCAAGAGRDHCGAHWHAAGILPPRDASSTQVSFGEEALRG